MHWYFMVMPKMYGFLKQDGIDFTPMVFLVTARVSRDQSLIKCVWCVLVAFVKHYYNHPDNSIENICVFFIKCN